MLCLKIVLPLGPQKVLATERNGTDIYQSGYVFITLDNRNPFSEELLPRQVLWLILTFLSILSLYVPD